MEDCQLERELELVEDESHEERMDGIKRVDRIEMVGRVEMVDRGNLEKQEVKEGRVENVKVGAQNEEQEENKTAEQAKSKLKRVVEKKLKWKIDVVEEKEEEEGRESCEKEEKVDEKELMGGKVKVFNTRCMKKDMLRVNEREGEKMKEGKRERREFGWREALAVDPLLQNLHLKLDHIFFPKSQVCQVPFDM